MDVYFFQICLNLPLDDDLKSASEVIMSQRHMFVTKHFSMSILNVIHVRFLFGFVSDSDFLKNIFVYRRCHVSLKGDEAKDDNHGLALHLLHMEYLHLPQGRQLKMTIFVKKMALLVLKLIF